MLKKDKMLPGSLIKVRPVIKCGLPANMMADDDDGLLEHLTLQLAPGAANPFFTTRQAGPGAVLEVVKGPKKTNGINCAMVKVPGEEGDYHVYWCELRASCDHI